MTTFKLDDVVRIVKQPPHTDAKVVGEVGFVGEIGENCVLLHALHPDGRIKGCGGAPNDCLALENDPMWHTAKAVYDATLEKCFQEGMARRREYEARVVLVAAKYDVTVETAEAIYHEMRSFSS